MERIRLIIEGVRADDAKEWLEIASLGRNATLAALDLPVATFNRKVKAGGRWKARGQADVYASASRAPACLKTVVYLAAGGLPLNRYLVEISIPTAVWDAARRETVRSLPVGWDAEPARLTSAEVGGLRLREVGQRCW